MEDDAGLARLAQRRLKRAGYEVSIASNGDEGLRMYSEGDYDLVAIDHNMPGKDGLEVVQILKAGTAPPPMVMITGSGNESLAVEALKLGVGDYLIKDVDGGYLDLLPTVLAHVLESERVAKEKQLAEAALEVSEARYRALFESMPIGLYSLNLDGVILSANEALAQILGVSREDLIGTEIYRFAIGNLAQIWQNILRTEKPVDESELCLVRGDGSQAWIRATATVVSESNKGVHIEGSVEDVTARHAADEKIARQRALLDAINQIFRGTIMDNNEQAIAEIFVQLALRITGSQVSCIQLDSQVALTAFADEEPGMYIDAAFCQQLQDQGIGLDSGDRLSKIVSGSPTLQVELSNKESLPIARIMSLELRNEGLTFGRLVLANKPDPYSEQDQSDAETLTTAFVEAIIRKRAEEERRHLIEELQRALTQVRTLGGLLPICASCKKIRTDAGYWQEVELYFSEHSEAEFTHGLCPDCAAKYMAEIDELEQMQRAKAQEKDEKT